MLYVFLSDCDNNAQLMTLNFTLTFPRKLDKALSLPPGEMRISDSLVLQNKALHIGNTERVARRTFCGGEEYFFHLNDRILIGKQIRNSPTRYFGHLKN